MTASRARGEHIMWQGADDISMAERLDTTL